VGCTNRAYKMENDVAQSTAKLNADIDRLYFPSEMCSVIGLSKNEIAFMKRQGCPFYGRKTTIRWVRAFIAAKAGAEESPYSSRLERPQRKAVSKSCAQAAMSDLPTSSLASRIVRRGGTAI